jgi:hypothetical protein
MCQACPRDRTMASFFKYVYAYWNARFMDPAVQDLYVLLTDVPVTKEQLPTNDDRVSKMAALVRGDKIHVLELHFGVPGKTLYDASPKPRGGGRVFARRWHLQRRTKELSEHKPVSCLTPARTTANRRPDPVPRPQFVPTDGGDGISAQTTEALTPLLASTRPCRRRRH